LHVIATPEIAKREKLKSVVRRVQLLVFWVSEVEEVRRSTSGFAKSRNPISRKGKEKIPNVSWVLIMEFMPVNDHAGITQEGL
jgi:hypothetical protein